MAAGASAEMWSDAKYDHGMDFGSFVAYFTNRQWVFHSEAHTIQETAREIVSFFLCRMATGIVDWGGMLFLRDVFIGTMSWSNLL